MVDAGIGSLAAVTNSSFSLAPITGPDITPAQMTALLKPITAKLDSLDIKYDHSVTEYANFYDHYQAEFAAFPATYAVNVAQYGGRLIPRSAAQHNKGAVTNAFRHIADLGAIIAMIATSPTEKVAGDVYNAVNPAWRNTVLTSIIQTPWSFTAPWKDMVALKDEMTDVLLPPLIKATPGSGVYLNEVQPTSCAIE